MNNEETFSSHSVVDYKFWCISNKAEFCFVCYDRFLDSETSTPTSVFDLYDVRTWTPIRQHLSSSYRNAKFKDVPPPVNLNEMITTAEKLSVGFPVVRVDLYNQNGKIYFGEMTFTSQGGRMNYFTDEFQAEIGNRIKI